MINDWTSYIICDWPTWPTIEMLIASKKALVANFSTYHEMALMAFLKLFAANESYKVSYWWRKIQFVELCVYLRVWMMRCVYCRPAQCLNTVLGVIPGWACGCRGRHTVPTPAANCPLTLNWGHTLLTPQGSFIKYSTGFYWFSAYSFLKMAQCEVDVWVPFPVNHYVLIRRQHTLEFL